MHKPANNRILVRFHTKRAEIRDQIVAALGLENAEMEKRSRDLLRRINEGRKRKAQDQGIAPARAGMLGDTGKQVFGKHGLPNVSLAEIHSDLLACGFVLVGGRIVQEPQVDQAEGSFTPTNKQKWVIDVEYLADSGETTDLELAKRVEAFLVSHRIQSTVHVWDNPDGSATINCVGEQDGSPERINVLRYHPRRGFRKDEAMGSPPAGPTLLQKLREKIEAVAKG